MHNLVSAHYGKTFDLCSGTIQESKEEKIDLNRRPVDLFLGQCDDAVYTYHKDLIYICPYQFSRGGGGGGQRE